MNFGYTINKPRTIDMDVMDNARLDTIIKQERTILLCIGCGSCSATCSAGRFTDMNLRMVLHMVRRGEFATARASLSDCMLCGKCRMVCPRGVNTRAAINTLLRTL